jgi:putative ABC transport system permease protein
VRSLLTTLGIVIGIMTIIAIVAIVEGLNRSFADQLSAIGQGVIYVQKFPWASNDWRKYRAYPDLGFKEYRAIAAETKNILGASPILMDHVTVKYENRKLEMLSVSGVNEQYGDIRGMEMHLGRNLSAMDVTSNRFVCVLGWEVAEKLFGLRDPIGRRIRVGRDWFQVIGVAAKRGDFFDQNLDQFVMVPYTTFEKSFEYAKRHFTIVVKAADATRIEDVKDELRALMRRVRKVPLNKPDNFAINEADVLKDLYQKLTGGLYAAMFAVAGISLLVGGIGIMNIMLVSVTERTREIGVRKALGARRRAILLQFLFEAMVIAAAGGVLGSLLGSGAARLVDAVTPLPARVTTWSVVLGIAFSSAVGMFFGLFPARAAAKKDPIEALRYE